MKRRSALLTLLRRREPATPVLSLQDTMLATAPANLLALWPLNETSGTTALDASGNGRNGTYSGSGITLNQSVAPFTCPTFAGTLGQNVNVFSAGLASVFSGSSGTALVFLRTIVVTSTSRTAIYVTSGDGSIIAVDRANSAVSSLYGDDAVISQAITANTWYCVALTWSGGSSRLYVNGISVGSAAPSTPWGSTLNAVTLAAATAGGNRWIGQLAYCALWDTPLDATQLAAITTASGI